MNRIKEFIKYDPITGVFTWIKSPNNRALVGSIAGVIINTGYRHICLDGKKYSGHRLAYFFINGKFPSRDMDHINGIKDDNKWSNLREVSDRENQSNRTSHRAGRLVGASFRKISKKWGASITIKRKSVWIGEFKTEHEAHLAYMKKRIEVENSK